MIWVVIILVIIVIFLFKANRETIELSKIPFDQKYAIVLDGLNTILFNKCAKYVSKDIREHYLYFDLLIKTGYIEFINRENSLYLTYYENSMGYKTSFSYTYSNTKYITDEQQLFIVRDFSEKVKNHW